MSILFAVLVSVFLFYLMAIVCDEFFVPAIDVLAKKLKMSSDVSGATLLASGSSAPEFFSSLFAIFGLAGASADVGAGTIVGSAVFNVLVIIGLSAMFKAVTLQWKPIVRDLGFYVLTIILLYVFFIDGQIGLAESIGFLALYGLYIYATLKWRTWFHYEDQTITETYLSKASSKNWLNDFSKRTLGYIIPNVEKKPKLYLVTFSMSIFVIAISSYILVDQLISSATTLGINPTFLALTVLAVGTSVPDLVSSIIVAKQGRGDMAVGNAIGSNVFNILFGLGFPWALYLALNSGTIAVGTDNLNASILLLLATVIAIVFLLLIRNWKIGHKSGLLLVVMYFAYLAYEISRL